MTTVLLVALGAAIGAPLRYYTDRAIQSRHDGLLPWGTLAVNVGGSLLFGVLTGGAAAGGLSAEVLAAAGVGFCGALTTYSTLGYETVRLARDGSRVHAVLNAVLSLAAGLVAAWLGFTVAEGVWA